MFDFTKKQVFIAMTLLLGVAFWLRFYQHHEWLIFKWDQARDALLLFEAIENGPEYLPLLGPRATKVGNDYLRLGPAYYYILTFSGWLFNSTRPDVFAYPDLFFSILVLPLFYFFLRLYFNRFHSFLGVLLYGTSFLIVQYSRFSWNPNSVPFFLLLTFYSLLRFLKTEKERSRLVWLALMTFATVIAGQFHFFAFFSLAGILGLYFFFLVAPWKKNNLKNFFQKAKSFFALKALAVILLVVAVFYSPMIISEIKTGGSNSKNFIGAFSEKPKDKPLGAKIIRNFREQGKNYFLLITSFRHRQGMKTDPVPIGFSWIFLIASLSLLVWKIRKEKDVFRKNFLLLILVWVVTFFLVTIPMSYQLRPRFFVVVFALPYVFLALWFDFFVEKINKKMALILTLLVVLLVLVGNGYGIYCWFEQNRLSENQLTETGRHFILKKDDGINLGQLERAVEYLLEKQPKEKIVYYSKPEYESSIKYLIKQRVSNKEVEFVKEIENLEELSTMFAFNTTKGGWKSVSEKIKNYTEIIEMKQFGQVTVFWLKIDQEKVRGYLNEKNGLEVISQKNQKEVETGVDEDDIEEVEEVEKKTERLFWKDVFEKGDDEFKEEIKFKE